MSGERGPWYRSIALGAALLAIVVIAAGMRRAGLQGVGTDFHVFWQAGYDFAHGFPLYQPLPGARRFLYPPFAAQVFQLLSLVPLRTAAALFYVGSVGLIILALCLTSDIVRRLEPTRRAGPRPVILSLAVSAGFMLDNLVHVQVNMLTLVLCLLGIRAFIHNRDLAAGGWLVTATAVKITPVFFLAWAVIRGRPRTVAAIAGFGALSVVLPLLQRGFSQGMADLTTYYHTFLHQFAAGGVVTVFRNQNLAAMVYRALVPAAGRDEPYEYSYLPSFAAAAPGVYRVAAVMILIAFLTYLFRARIAARPVGALEISTVFLAAHLLSGITWKAHLVTLLFVSYVFFSLDPRPLTGWQRGGLWLAWGGMIVAGLGRDVVGSRLHHYLAGYSMYVWVMLLLFGLSIWVTAGNRDVSGNSKPRERAET